MERAFRPQRNVLPNHDASQNSLVDKMQRNMTCDTRSQHQALPPVRDPHVILATITWRQRPHSEERQPTSQALLLRLELGLDGSPLEPQPFSQRLHMFRPAALEGSRCTGLGDLPG